MGLSRNGPHRAVCYGLATVALMRLADTGDESMSRPDLCRHCARPIITLPSGRVVHVLRGAVWCDYSPDPSRGTRAESSIGPRVIRRPPAEDISRVDLGERRERAEAHTRSQFAHTRFCGARKPTREYAGLTALLCEHFAAHDGPHHDLATELEWTED